MEGKLDKWQADKLTDAQIVLDIEREIAGGHVDPAWILEKGTKREHKALLKFGSENHANHHVIDHVQAAHPDDPTHGGAGLS